MAEREFGAGMAATLPILIGVAPFGLLMGGIGAQAGLSPLEVALMSALVFAGSSQFVAVGMWTHPTPVLALVMMALLVNSRHILFSAGMAPSLDGIPARRAFPAMFFLTDEGFALAMARSRQAPLTLTWWMGAGSGLWLAWLASTTTGAVLGAVIQNPARYGLDFAFLAVFVALARGLWRGAPSLLPWLASAAAALLADRLLGPPWHVLAGAIAAMVVAAASREPR